MGLTLAAIGCVVLRLYQLEQRMDASDNQLNRIESYMIFRD